MLEIFTKLTLQNPKVIKYDPINQNVIKVIMGIILNYGYGTDSIEQCNITFK